MNTPNGIMVIGVGNRFRGDDAAGLIAADRLRAASLPRVTVSAFLGDAAALIEQWQDAESVVIIDAVVSGAPPGTIHCVAVSEKTLPEDIATTSTHSFGLRQAVELARTLGRLPQQLTVVGIEGASFEPGTGLSAAVSDAMNDAVTKVRELLKRRAQQPRDVTGDES